MTSRFIIEKYEIKKLYIKSNMKIKVGFVTLNLTPVTAYCVGNEATYFWRSSTVFVLFMH